MKRARPGLVEFRFAAEGFRPLRARWRGGWRALGLALVVHVALLAVLLTGVRWSRPPASVPIRAYVADREPTPAKPVEPDKPRTDPAREAAEAKKRREQESRKAADAEKKRQEAKRLAAEEKKRADQKRRADDDKKQAEKRQREDEARRRKEAEQSLQESLAAEETARKEATRRARMQSQLGQYRELVKQRVSRNWSRPPGAPKGLKCTVRVRLAPGGEVLGAAVTRSSGNVAFDRSVEAAVYKAAPLPVPTERELFEQFREIDFEFIPED
jgi:colicin import membrane protein